MTPLLKAEGSGNDFIIGWDHWAARLADEPDLVERLCRRHRGIGADGVLALFPEPVDRLRVIYRNRDGSRALFCANGARCAARVGNELLGLDQALVLQTDWAPIPARVTADGVSIDLPQPDRQPRPTTLELDGTSWRGHLLEVGVPHFIVKLGDGLDAIDLNTLGRGLAHHADLGPGAANISFVEMHDADRAHIRSFELGVEAETLSCGSGVVAAALTILAEGGLRHLELLTASGDTLMVEALSEPPTCRSRLTGPARLVAHLEPTAELDPRD